MSIIDVDFSVVDFGDANIDNVDWNDIEFNGTRLNDKDFVDMEIDNLVQNTAEFDNIETNDIQSDNINADSTDSCGNKGCQGCKNIRKLVDNLSNKDGSPSTEPKVAARLEKDMTAPLKEYTMLLALATGAPLPRRWIAFFFKRSLEMFYKDTQKSIELAGEDKAILDELKASLLKHLPNP